MEIPARVRLEQLMQAWRSPSLSGVAVSSRSCRLSGRVRATSSPKQLHSFSSTARATTTALGTACSESSKGHRPGHCGMCMSLWQSPTAERLLGRQHRLGPSAMGYPEGTELLPRELLSSAPASNNPRISLMRFCSQEPQNTGYRGQRDATASARLQACQ